MKSQAPDRLLQLVADHEPAGKPVRVIHRGGELDRVGKFTAHRLTDVLCAAGIALEYLLAGQPKSNSKIKRWHGTLMPCLCGVLYARCLPLRCCRLAA
jgi:transposase InsO family protein